MEYSTYSTYSWRPPARIPSNAHHQSLGVRIHPHPQLSLRNLERSAPLAGIIHTYACMFCASPVAAESRRGHRCYVPRTSNGADTSSSRNDTRPDTPRLDLRICWQDFIHQMSGLTSRDAWPAGKWMIEPLPNPIVRYKSDIHCTVLKCPRCCQRHQAHGPEANILMARRVEMQSCG